MKFNKFILNENKNKENLDEVRIRIITDIAELKRKVESIIDYGPSRDSIKHIFMTQSAYDALETYEEDTLYLIIEHTSGSSKLGEDTFPLILG